MKVKNLKTYNEQTFYKKMTLDRQIEKCREGMVVQGLLTGGLATISTYLINEQPFTITTGCVVLLSFVGAYGFGLNWSEYKGLKEKQKYLTKKGN